MTRTSLQRWQNAYRRLELVEAELLVAEDLIETSLASLPSRLPNENYLEWINRGQKMAAIISFKDIDFHYLTDIKRYVADTRETDDALPEIPLVSEDQQFRLTVSKLSGHKLKLMVEALGYASSVYANSLIGIAASNSKDQIISVIHLNADGDGVDENLENTPAIRSALLNPVLALIKNA